MEVDFECPVGAVLDITNGFDSGHIYYGRDYRLQRRADGVWQDVPMINLPNVPDDTRSLGPGEAASFVQKYWAWLYGELPPGEYRIWKSFLHRIDRGEDTRHERYAAFTLDGQPISGLLRRRDGDDWFHPFYGISTFRAEVMELIAPDTPQGLHLGAGSLLVGNLSPLWEDGRTGNMFYITENHAVTVLNADNEQIPLFDIAQGAIVDITFSGIVLTSDPAIIGGALLIQIIR